MKKYSKRLIGVVLLAILTLFLSFNTMAEETTKSECDNSKGEAQNILDKYNLQIEKVSDDGKYRIRIAGDSKDIKEGVFEITGAEVGKILNPVETIAKIKKGQDAEFYATPDETDDGLKLIVKVKMVEGSTLLKDCDYVERLGITDYGDSKTGDIFAGNYTIENDKSIYKSGSICYNFYNGIWDSNQFKGIKEADFKAYNYQATAGLTINGKSAQSVYQTTLAYCFQQYVTVGAEYSEKNLVNMIGNAITYVKSRTKTIGGTNKTFAEMFDEIKNHPNVKNKTGKAAEDLGITCDWEKTATTGDANDYYKNKKYYYKEENTGTIEVTYKYNYAPGDKDESTHTVCTRKCAEAVKVEYGPPVASKAGLCFEYKVKVTSYVECTADITLDPPKLQTKYCSPVPFCHEKNWAWTGNQAGPVEEFDACIQSCDGGKYTSKCSKSCYKKVYKNSKLKLALSYENDIAQKLSDTNTDLDNCINAENSDGGCYYWSGNSIMWKSKFQGNADFQNDKRALGRWYREVNWYTGDVGEGLSFDVSSNGIKTKKMNTSTGHCQDICYWKTDKCTKGQYLNPQSALEDYKNNLKAYQSKEAECEAAATCQSTTAEFTISINYDAYVTEDNKKTKKKVTIDFPYSPLNKDKLSSLGEKMSNPENTFTHNNSTLLSYDGCYSASTEKNWYQAEWSFPGTYIHNKTGEISFKQEGKGDGWYYDDDKFCMPLEAESVNSKWWEWYKINNMNFGCYTREQIQAELNTDDNTSNGYNIKAKTTNFGYFNWNFDIRCFYALRNEICDVDENQCCKETCVGDSCTEINGVRNYMFRAINTSNIFPNAPTKPLEGVEAGKRPIGFNWTNKAANNKNENYVVNPANLIKQIQSESSTLYSMDNLDYQFYLTPETLWKIKEYNKKNPYGTWNGTVETKNGINVYYSNLWGKADKGIENTIDLRTIVGAVLKDKGCPGVNNKPKGEFCE